MLDLTEQLESKNVQFISKKESIDTNTPTGKFMLAVFGALAQLERENILERQAEGIAIAKAEGKMTGRPRKAVDTFADVYTEVKAGNKSASKGARELGISRSSWYRKAMEYAKGFPAFRIGKQYRVNREKFLAWLDCADQGEVA